MAVWYARKAANIDSANMWNAAANGSGAWLTWPPASGDILMANGFIVAVNTDVNLGASGEIRNDTSYGAAANGYYNVTASCTLTGNVFARTNGIYINTAGLTVTINGNSSFTGPPTNNAAIWLNAASTLTVNGNVTATNVATTRGVYQTAGTLIFNGNATGGQISTSYGIEIGSGAVATTINGIVTGGTQGDGLRHNGTSTITVTGSAVGGSAAAAYGINNASTGTINIVGYATGGSAGAGVNNASTGTITVTGYVQASASASGANNAAQGILEIGETRSASNGRGAVTGAFRYASATAAKSMPYTPDGQISMTVLDVAAIVPAAGDVRKGMVYGDGAYTGTLQLGRNRTSMAGRF